jgi:hypothetical protein
MDEKTEGQLRVIRMITAVMQAASECRNPATATSRSSTGIPSGPSYQPGPPHHPRAGVVSSAPRARRYLAGALLNHWW